MQTTITLADRVKAYQADNPKKTFDQCFSLALSDMAVTHNEPPNEVHMSDAAVSAAAAITGLKPGYDASALPPAMKAELLAQYRAIDEVLRDADIQYARQVAVQRIKPTVPVVTSAYKNALEAISNDPTMSLEAAKTLAREGMRIDQASAQARQNALVLPKLNPYNEPAISA